MFELDLTPKPPATIDLTRARLRLIGVELIQKVDAKLYQGGVVGVQLDGQLAYMSPEHARELSKALNGAAYNAEQHILRLRGGHLYRVLLRSGRLLVRRDDKEGWLEPTVIRILRRCVSCHAPQSPGSLMHRQEKPKLQRGEWLDPRVLATDPRHDRLCAACVAKAEPEKPGELVLLEAK